MLNLNCAIFVAVTLWITQKIEERVFRYLKTIICLTKNVSHVFGKWVKFWYTSLMCHSCWILYSFIKVSNFFAKSDCNHAFICTLLLLNYGWIATTDWLQIQEFSKNQLQHSVVISWLYEIYNKMCCICQYHLQVVTYIFYVVKFIINFYFLESHLLNI